MIVKNRTVPGGKEFWDHVEEVAAEVKANPAVYDLKNITPASQASTIVNTNPPNVH